MIAALLAAVALAAEPEIGLPPSDDPYEIVVWGENVIREARKGVIRAFEAQGWELHERGGELVFRPPSGWMGKAHLTREGTLTFGRPVLGVGRTWFPMQQYDMEETFERRDQGAVTPTVAFYVLPSKRLLQQVHADVLVTVDPALDGYHEAIAVTRFGEAVDALPARLDTLWNEGLALDGFTVLSTKAERRAHALELWTSRADTPEGERIRRAVASWLENTVQTSPDPLTAAEIRAAELKAGQRLGF